MAKLIFGSGYLGLRVARLWLRQGAKVMAVTRSADKAARLASEGIRPVMADITAAGPLELGEIGGVDTVLFAVGYERGSSASMEEVYVGGLAHVLSALPETIERMIYISSTGVYGDASGEWVNEETPCRPTRVGGKACLAAEELLLDSVFGSRSLVLRLAGLYGPGRIPRAEAIVAREPIDAPRDGFLNLIHVDDAAHVVLLAEANAARPRTYVVSDGHPVVRGEYYAELARLLGAPPPRFIAPDANSPAAQRAASDKRVDCRRLMSELSPVFCYPSYREGLAAIVAESRLSLRESTRSAGANDSDRGQLN